MTDQPADTPESTPGGAPDPAPSSSPGSSPAADAAGGKKDKDDNASVLIRARPKVIFLYPTFLAAVLGWAWTGAELGNYDAIEDVANEVLQDDGQVDKLISGLEERGGSRHVLEATLREDLALDEAAAQQLILQLEQRGALTEGGGLEQTSLAPGRIFWWVFCINMLVLGFDFSRGEFVAILMAFAVVTLSIILLNQRWEFVLPVAETLSHIKLWAHPHFYLLIACALAVIFIAVWVVGKFDYWEITHQELLHHRGLMGDVERYPAPSLRMTKEIVDLFEYCLAGSGRLVLHPQGSTRSTVLDNVLFVNHIEKRIQEMLSTLKVTVDMDHGHSE
jgi:hypothetical protein